MKTIKILSIVTLVLVVGVVGFLIYDHIQRNKSAASPLNPEAPSPLTSKVLEAEAPTYEMVEKSTVFN